MNYLTYLVGFATGEFPIGFFTGVVCSPSAASVFPFMRITFVASVFAFDVIVILLLKRLTMLELYKILDNLYLHKIRF